MALLWLSDPGPLNFWQTHFARTIANSRYHGRVHIMIVNADNAFSLNVEASALGDALVCRCLVHQSRGVELSLCVGAAPPVCARRSVLRMRIRLRA